MRVAIIGGGIGGLATAIALGKCGIEADVYEQAPELREVGAGIALASNALLALDLLGVGGEVRSRGVEDLQGGILRPDGKLLAAVPADELNRGVGNPVVLHRAELLDLLVQGADRARLHPGRTCVGIDEKDSAVEVRFADGESIRADVVVAADGLRSPIRERLFPGHRPRYAGYTAWRSVVEGAVAAAPGSHGSLTETWGPGRRFGVVPMSGGRVYWFATLNTAEGGRDPEGQSRARVAELFRGWHKPVEALVAASGTILRNDVYDIAPLPALAKGRVALLGDAAHAMTPNLGQGACQAIEDAVVLAASLAGGGSVESALSAYSRRRVARVRRFIEVSRQMGAIGQVENPILSAMRNALMRMTPPAAGARRIAALLEFEAISEEERARFRRGFPPAAQ